MTGNNEDTILKQTKAKRNQLQNKRRKIQRIYYGIMGIALIMIVVIPIVVLKNIEYPYTGFISLYIIVPISILPFIRMQIKNLEDELKSIDFDLDLQKFEVSKKEVRAEKILLINNYQLRRYYDLNLNQNIWVFGLGIFCIILGIAVIGVTLYLVLVVAQGWDSKLITGTVGAIGSFMTNYIAAIYLKMHASATSILGSFHSRLVQTQQLLFGNLLASRIEDDNIRWQTLSQLALNVSKHEDTEANS
jgi:hypothetical protein